MLKLRVVLLVLVCAVVASSFPALTPPVAVAAQGGATKLQVLTQGGHRCHDEIASGDRVALGYSVQCNDSGGCWVEVKIRKIYTNDWYVLDAYWLGQGSTTREECDFPQLLEHDPAGFWLCAEVHLTNDWSVKIQAGRNVQCPHQ